MSSSIMDKTKELCEAILNDDKFKEYYAVIDRFEQNEEENGDYVELLETQRDLHEKKDNDELTQADIDEFDKSCNDVLQRPVVKEFIVAQDALDQLIEQITQHVELTIELGRLPDESDFEEDGCCGSDSCGCGH